MRVELHLIGGDIYCNGKKIAFAVPFNPDNPTTEQEHGKYKIYTSVDWLIAWAKVGLMSQGHSVPDFPMGPVENFHAVEPHLEVQTPYTKGEEVIYVGESAGSPVYFAFITLVAGDRLRLQPFGISKQDGHKFVKGRERWALASNVKRRKATENEQRETGSRTEGGKPHSERSIP
jgi:hypothetical protein